MDRKNDGMGSLSVATRRVTTENAPLPGFCETRKDASGYFWQCRPSNGKAHSVTSLRFCHGQKK